MADAPKLQGTEKIGESYYKINMGIDNANEALRKSYKAEERSVSAEGKSNAADTLSKSVQQQLNEIVVEGSIDPETKQIRVDAKGVVYGTAKERVDAEQNKINTVSQIAPKYDTIWYPPKQPTARSDEPNPFADGGGWNSNQFIDRMWDPLRLEFPDYITRTLLGKDTSGQYDMWAYKFEPDYYDTTLILSASIHGGEVTGQLALYRFLYHVCHDWKKEQHLSYIRNKVRLIVVPMVNPWGVSQKPRTRYNVNGVDINRNFDYKWSAYVSGPPFSNDYKGTSPWSEAESRYIRDLCNDYKDAVAYLDLHNMGMPVEDYTIAVPKTTCSPKNLYVNLIETIKRSCESTLFGAHDTPSGYNYVAKTHGMHASNPEFADTKYGRAFDSAEMTKAVEWFSNVIICHANENKNAKINSVVQPFTVRGHYEASGDAPSLAIGSTLTEIKDLQLKFKVPASGILLFNATISIKGIDPSAIHTLSTAIIQTNSDHFTDSLLSAQLNYNQVLSEGDKRHTITICSSGHVEPSINPFSEVMCKLFGSTSSNTTQITRYRVTATFIPSDANPRYAMYNATERMGNGYDTMVLTYPPQ